MKDVKLPYTSVDNFREDTIFDMEFLDGITLHKYRLSIAKKHGYRKIKPFEEFITRRNEEVNECPDEDNIIREHFINISKLALVNFFENLKFDCFDSIILSHKKVEIYEYLVHIDKSISLYDFTNVIKRSHFNILSITCSIPEEYINCALISGAKTFSKSLYMVALNNYLHDVAYEIVKESYFYFLHTNNNLNDDSIKKDIKKRVHFRNYALSMDV